MHQSFSGKKFQTVLVSAAQRFSLLNTAPVVQRERDWNDGDVQVQKTVLFRAQLEQTSTGKAVSSVDTANIVKNSHL